LHHHDNTRTCDVSKLQGHVTHNNKRGVVKQAMTMLSAPLVTIYHTVLVVIAGLIGAIYAAPLSLPLTVPED